MLPYYVIASIIFIAGVSSRIPSICDEEPLNTFIPDVRDCKAWFFCGTNGPIRGICSNQYLFNPESRTCDWPQNVDCFQCPSNVGIHKIAIEGTCRMFIQCINGIATQNVCQDGLQFNEITGQCDLESVVQCERGFRCPDEFKNNESVIAIRDNRNCSVYYLCAGDAKAIRQECNAALHFDSITSLCTYPRYTDCLINPNSEGAGDGPGNSEPELTEPTLQSDPIDTTFTPIQWAIELLSEPSTESFIKSPYESESPTESPIEALIEPFECESNGIYPDQTERSEYYICVSYVPYHMRCAEGLHFNVANLQCDFP